ncbi:MAG: sigma-70 family RNA polymerase sigma factor [Actinobacteria bacterium]|nr:sigma-70 family RNA polymerase sigma factor [Actinomycetota bacterium]
MEDRSFEEFYEEEYSAVLALARVLTGDLTRAEDVAHDAFIAALEAWDTVENAAGWIRRVTANKSHSAWRRRYAERRALSRVSQPIRIGMDVPSDTEAFWGQVRRLPRRQAQAIALFYLEDRSISQIAELLECSESTARVHLVRGRRTLAKRLDLEL